MDDDAEWWHQLDQEMRERDEYEFLVDECNRKLAALPPYPWCPYPNLCSDGRCHKEPTCGD